MKRNEILIINKKNISQLKMEDSNYTWNFYKKKPLEISAIQMKKPFSVETLEGTMSGKAGDYLIRGINGELYPCDKKIFEKSYDLIFIQGIIGVEKYSIGVHSREGD